MSQFTKCVQNRKRKYQTIINWRRSGHGIIGVHSPPPPLNFRSPLDTKAPGLPLIYLVGPLAISEPRINICVGAPNTCVALKQFNLLPSNTP